MDARNSRLPEWQSHRFRACIRSNDGSVGILSRASLRVLARILRIRSPRSHCRVDRKNSFANSNGARIPGSGQYGSNLSKGTSGEPMFLYSHTTKTGSPTKYLFLSKWTSGAYLKRRRGKGLQYPCTRLARWETSAFQKDCTVHGVSDNLFETREQLGNINCSLEALTRLLVAIRPS